MAEDKRDILSEYTKDMTPEQREQLRKQIAEMTEEELADFRNSVEADDMGFYGEESV